MAEDVEQLLAKWLALFATLDVDGGAAGRLFADLVARYGEDGRYYHNLRHIANVLHTVESLREYTTEWTAVQLAAWFHDAIYHLKPTSPSNEVQSAAYAASSLQAMKIPAETVAWVSQLIQATELNAPIPADANFQVLLDADLAILAAEWQGYVAYAQAIRQEYAFVPDEAYRNGRCQVLQSFLDRERIYRTDKMFQANEQKARQNIQREITMLSSGGNS